MKIFSAGSCRLKRRCGSPVSAGCIVAAATRPRSCHGSSPGGTAPRAVSAFRVQSLSDSWQLCLLVDRAVISSCRDGAPHHGGARGLHPDARDHHGQLCQQPEEKVSRDNILILAFCCDGKGHLTPSNYECNRCHNWWCLINCHTVIISQ